MNLSGPLIALAAFGIFSTHDVVVKVLGATYSPFQIIFFSTAFSFPLVTFMLMRDATEGNLRPVHGWWVAARTLSAAITAFSGFYAFSVLPMAQVYVMLFASPLLITILSIPMLGERVGIHRSLAVLAGLAGVVIVLRPGTEPLGLGHLAGVTAATANSFGSVVVRKIGKDERTAVLMLYPMAVNFIVMGAILGLVYEPMPLVHLAGMGVISVLGFSAGLLLIVAYRNGDATVVAPMQYSQIVWATVFGTLLFNETIDLPTAIGAAIIIASGIYIVFRESRLGARSQTPVLRSRSRPSVPSSLRVSTMLRRDRERR